MPRIDIHSNKEEVLREVKIDGNSLYQANVKFKDDIDIVTKFVDATTQGFKLCSRKEVKSSILVKFNKQFIPPCYKVNI